MTDLRHFRQAGVKEEGAGQAPDALTAFHAELVGQASSCRLVVARVAPAGSPGASRGHSSSGVGRRGATVTSRQGDKERAHDSSEPLVASSPPQHGRHLARLQCSLYRSSRLQACSVLCATLERNLWPRAPVVRGPRPLPLQAHLASPLSPLFKARAARSGGSRADTRHRRVPLRPSPSSPLRSPRPPRPGSPSSPPSRSTPHQPTRAAPSHSSPHTGLRKARTGNTHTAA